QFSIPLEILPAECTVDGIINKVTRIGQLLDRSQAAQKLVERIRQQADELAQKVDAMPRRPRVVFVMNTDTSGLMVAGRSTAAAAAIELAGGEQVVTDYSGYKPLSAEALITLRPDALLIMQTSEKANTDLQKNTAVMHTPAGRNGDIIPVDGEA